MTEPTSVVVEPGTPVRVTSKSGSVVVIGEDRADVLVDGAKHSTRREDGVEISGRSGTVTVRAPAGTDVFAGTGSGAVSLRGPLGDVRVNSESGSISIEQATAVDARTGSGSIEVLDCARGCRCHSGSGSLNVERAGATELVTGSGSVEARSVASADVYAGSGSVQVGLSAPGEVAVKAHSGSVAVTLPSGVHPDLDLKAAKGAVRCDCEPGPDGSVHVRTSSGAITVTER
jgi:DUF4097 and DUF4098 domain-containing protein YvlB